MTTDPLVEAIYQHRLPQVARQLSIDAARSEADRARALSALTTCERIGERVDAERDRLVSGLQGVGIEVRRDDTRGPRQNHTITLQVTDHATAERAGRWLATEGFEPWERWIGGAGRSFRHFSDHLTMARTTDVTTVVRVRWTAAVTRSTLRRIVTPTAGDWHMVDLPPSMWRLYSVVRPVRLVLERVGLRNRHDDSLGPFLSTPDALIDPLLAFGGVGPEDCLVDIGCGDGRIVVAAAQRLGCRSIGVERSSSLAALARVRAADDGVTEHVEIREADGRTVDLDGATVVFMFLPIDVVGDLLDSTLRQLPHGARLIVHEQSRLPAAIQPAPSSSMAVIADDAVTVAHLWIAP